MKIKFGAIVTDGRKKLGGHVFSKNRYGNYVRTNGIPTNPQTVFQQQQRARLAIFSEGWSNLTEAQRETWNNTVENFKRTDVFGDLKKPTGKNLYTRLNMELNLTQQNQLDTAPEPTDVGGVSKTSGTYSLANGFNITASVFGAAVPGAYSVVLVATPPVTAGTRYVKNKFRVIDAVSFLADEFSSPQDIAQAYTNRFGFPVEGQKIYYGMYIVAPNGERSVLAKSAAVFVEA